MPRIDFDAITPNNMTGYPEPFDEPVQGRWKRPLGRLAGLTHLGATHVTLTPGAWSSQRHWHHGEDELLVMLSGQAVLIEDAGETVLRPGDCVAWPAGIANGHQLVNRSETDCAFLCLSAGDASAGGVYPDIDMIVTANGYLHKDGTPYPKRPPR